MLSAPAAGLAEDANSKCVVDHQPGPKALLQFDSATQVGNIAPVE